MSVLRSRNHNFFLNEALKLWRVHLLFSWIITLDAFTECSPGFSSSLFNHIANSLTVHFVGLPTPTLFYLIPSFPDYHILVSYLLILRCSWDSATFANDLHKALDHHSTSLYIDHPSLDKCQNCKNWNEQAITCNFHAWRCSTYYIYIVHIL